MSFGGREPLEELKRSHIPSRRGRRDYGVVVGMKERMREERGEGSKGGEKGNGSCASSKVGAH